MTVGGVRHSLRQLRGPAAFHESCVHHWNSAGEHADSARFEFWRVAAPVHERQLELAVCVDGKE